MADLFSGFLDSLTGGGSSGGSFLNSAFNALLAGATGGFKQRPQWRDLQFMNDATNRLWPDEIKRQGQFLEGLAPSQGAAMETLAPYQAGAYNTYQDATFAQDTARQTDRIKTMASGLGMSPWEITGAGGATPLPSPSGPMPQGAQGRNPMPDFLSALTPLKIAEMSNKTQLMTAKMSNDTSRYIADQQTGKGKLVTEQINEIRSRIDLNEVAKSNGIKDLDVKNQGMVTNMIQTMLSAMPQDTISIGPVTTTNKPGGMNVLRKLLKDNQQFPGDAGRLNDAIAALPPDDWNHLKRIIITGATDAADSISDFATGVGDFLKGLTGDK